MNPTGQPRHEGNHNGDHSYHPPNLHGGHNDQRSGYHQQQPQQHYHQQHHNVHQQATSSRHHQQQQQLPQTTSRHHNNATAVGYQQPQVGQQPQQQQPQQAQQQQPQQQPQQQQQQQPQAQSNGSSMVYFPEKLAGSGSFGLVYQARILDPVTGVPGEIVAIKKVYLDPDFKNRELQIMSELNHPCVVTLRHCFYIQDPATNKTYMNLVMSFVPENIHTYIRHHSRSRININIDLVRRYIYQILRGLAYVHGKGICHRDLKPHNILINSSTHEVKLCDFGSAKCLSPTENNVSYICSRFYRAPELALGARRYTTAVDMWSAGCVFAELITGKPLFAGVAPEDQILCIIQILGFPTSEDYPRMELKEHDALEAIATSARNPPRSAVHRQLHNGYQGSGLAQALGPNCPPEALDLLAKLLTYDPTRRLTAFDSLAHPFFEPLHRPNDQSFSSSLYHWEINQHQWTEDEAAAIAALPIADRAMLFPPWLKQHSSKRIQSLAGYSEIEQYHNRVREQQQQQQQQPSNQSQTQSQEFDAQQPQDWNNKNTHYDGNQPQQQPRQQPLGEKIIDSTEDIKTDGPVARPKADLNQPIPVKAGTALLRTQQNEDGS